jgi:hypothetical protein
VPVSSVTSRPRTDKDDVWQAGFGARRTDEFSRFARSLRATESDGGVELMTGQNGATGSERLAAHERLSTGALARWMRACASHPWRVVFSWIGIIGVVVVLVATVGGGLRDEFKIPGSDTQKATDLIESQFASEQGSVLNLVCGTSGQRLDTPARKAAIEQRPRLKSQVKPKQRQASGVSDPFSKDTYSGRRIAYAEARSTQTIESATATRSRASGHRAGACRPRACRLGTTARAVPADRGDRRRPGAAALSC